MLNLGTFCVIFRRTRSSLFIARLGELCNSPRRVDLDRSLASNPARHSEQSPRAREASTPTRHSEQGLSYSRGELSHSP